MNRQLNKWNAPDENCYRCGADGHHHSTRMRSIRQLLVGRVKIRVHTYYCRECKKHFVPRNHTYRGLFASRFHKDVVEKVLLLHSQDYTLEKIEKTMGEVWNCRVPKTTAHDWIVLFGGDKGSKLITAQCGDCQSFVEVDKKTRICPICKAAKILGKEVIA